MLLIISVFLVVPCYLEDKIFEVFQNSSLKRQGVKTGTYEKSNEALLSGLHQCVVTTFQSMVLFFWRKLMNLLRSSIKMTLQH